MTPVLQATKLVEIFVNCDDFIKSLNDHQIERGYATQACLTQASERMSTSEMMSIAIFYHHSGFKCFKYYYEQIILGPFKSYFPRAYSYTRFIQLMPRINFPLFVFLCASRLSSPSAGNYIDATKLVVCHNKRIFNHKVFKKLARRGKTSTGWFFGFKLHAVINQYGQLVIFNLTSGNVADNNPSLLRKITERLEGFLYGDAGYISSIVEELRERGVHLITKLRKNMKSIKRSAEQSHYLSHRGLIESVFNLLKNHCDIEHTRHRSIKNFLINLWSGLVAYSFMDELPQVPKMVRKVSTITECGLVLC